MISGSRTFELDPQDCLHYMLLCYLVTKFCLTHLPPHGPTRFLCPWNFPGKNTGVGCHSLLQGIFLTQGSNPGPLCVLHGRQILYHWSTREALYILFGFSFPFRSSQGLEWSFLSYLVGSHRLFILYVVLIVYIWQSQSPNKHWYFKLLRKKF